MRNVAACLGYGVLVTLLTAGASFGASLLGFPHLARVLFWPNTLLQSLAPCYEISFNDWTLCEGGPFDVAALADSLPLSVVAYAVIAYALRRRGRASGG